MTTDQQLAKREPSTAMVDQVTETTLETQLAYAAEIAKSGLIPENFRKRPENVLVAIEWGRELGLTPIASLNEIYVVHGSPSLSAKAMLMLARRAGHRVRVTGEATQATCQIVRADDPDYPHEVTYTLDDAKQAGLMGNTGWKNDPKTMLRWRAVANAVRLACPEVLGGISYLPEEVEEIARRNSGSASSVTQVPTVEADPARTAADYMKALKLNGKQLKEFTSRLLGDQVSSWEKLSESDRKRVLDGLAQWLDSGIDPTTGEIVEAELVDDEPKPNPSLRSAISAAMANFGRLGVTSREERLALTARITGQKVNSTNDLSVAQVRDMVATLEQAKDLDALNASIDKRQQG